MPIDKEEFNAGKSRSELEDDIVLFLNERAEKAFTSQEIMDGLEHFPMDFSSPDIAQMSAFAAGDFTAFLYDLVKKGKITMKVIKGRMHFLVEEGSSNSTNSVNSANNTYSTYNAISTARTTSGKCPKCGIEVADPKKTWTMTGRPDREGQRLELLIGLFECPIHGAFRAMLGKQKV